MAWYLLELFMEEIPARMQEKAETQLRALLEEKLKAENLEFSLLQTFVTPRRLGVVIEGLPFQQLDRVEEKKGPSVDASPQAIEGFLTSMGITVDQCEKRTVPGKGTFYFVSKVLKGKNTQQVIAPIITEIIQEFQWPKSMRWGSYQLSWIRPLRSIVSLFDGEILPLSVEDPHVSVGRTVHGHRFLAPEPFTVHNFEEYKTKLESHYVIWDREKRSNRILEDLRSLCTEHGFQLKEDPELLKEVTGLVEWPVVLMGKIDHQFMSLPPEVLETTMRTHQRYFSVLNADGTPAPRFLVVSNVETIDKGDRIIEGNERVLRARLSDAAFFWQQDQKIPLLQRTNSLKDLIFHEKLGSVFTKVKRIEKLVIKCLPAGSDKIDDAVTAVSLCKNDLVTGMVGEFPELQGIMGGYYARNEGIDSSIAQAIREHYAPLGPSDRVPTASLSVAVSLADKIDTLVAFWSVGIQPTGSKDPYALRRTALGALRLLLENELSFDLLELCEEAYKNLDSSYKTPLYERAASWKELEEFLIGRLKVLFKTQGFNFSFIEAVFPNERNKSCLNVYESYIILQALSCFLNKQEGRDLLAAYKRASNILAQSTAQEDLSVNAALFQQDEERALYNLFQLIKGELVALVSQYSGKPSLEYYEEILKKLSSFRKPLDDFFENVTVNSDDQQLRLNRLVLLKKVRLLMNEVADFSLIVLPS